MAHELTYSLHDPGFTIYHRAALGGLAATIYAWQQTGGCPQGVHAEFSRHQVTISWGDELTDQEAISGILAASFRVRDNMIEIPAQGPRGMGDDLRLALHNGYSGTFLQHNKMRPPPAGSRGPRTITITDPDTQAAAFLSYRPVESYAHQKAQRTGLLDKPRMPSSAVVSQAYLPGAFAGAQPLEVPAREAFLLLFLIAGSTVFLLRSRRLSQKAQYCLIVPDIVDLESFAESVASLAQSASSSRFMHTYVGRVVGGLEEAALKFLIDVRAGEQVAHPAVRSCLAVAMGKVAWDRNQINRSAVSPIRSDYDEWDVFAAACESFGTRLMKDKKTEMNFAFPASQLPALVAANLAAGDHWCSHFSALVSDQAEFRSLGFQHGGLVKMKEAIQDELDRLVIDVFHEAWRRTMGGLASEAGEAGHNASRRIEVRRERIRNEILRAKTQGQLANWFLDFAARATSGGSLEPLRRPEAARRFREFIFDPREFSRFQNLCLFALLSYSSRAMNAGASADDPEGE